MKNLSFSLVLIALSTAYRLFLIEADNFNLVIQIENDDSGYNHIYMNKEKYSIQNDNIDNSINIFSKVNGGENEKEIKSILDFLFLNLIIAGTKSNKIEYNKHVKIDFSSFENSFKVDNFQIGYSTDKEDNILNIKRIDEENNLIKFGNSPEYKIKKDDLNTVFSLLRKGVESELIKRFF